MIKRVLIISLVVFVICLIIFWLLTGGWAAISRTAHSLSNPIELIFGSNTNGSFFKFPWQPTELTRGPDISDYVTEADARNRASGDEDQASNGQTPPRQNFSNASPYVGKVRVTDNTASESAPSKEFIQLSASESNTEPILISSWSLQSGVSGLRASIPQAAPLFVLGVVNGTQPIYLEPGTSVFVTTGASPIGVSFRENICSGYLNELQTFVPELSSECPAPSESLPMNADTLRTYGSSCFDYVNGLSQCHFPDTVPSNLSSACRSLVANTVLYNGCINTFRNRIPFALPTFRAFLGLRAELWANSHDVIRLLDDQGRTVDVLTY